MTAAPPAPFRDTDARIEAAERGLAAAEARLRALLEAFPEAVVVVGADRRIVTASAEADKLFGVAAGGLRERPVEVLVPESQSAEWLRLCNEHLGDPGSRPTRSFIDNLAGHRRDGGGFPLEAVLTPMQTHEGPTLLLVLRDATMRRLTHEALQESLELQAAHEKIEYQKTLLESQNEASIDGILIVDPDSRIVSYNRRFLEMWGLDPALVKVGRSDEDALASALPSIADPAAFVGGVERLAEHPDETVRDEVVLKDGRTFERWTTPVRGDMGTSYGRGWYFRDITQRKQAELQVRRANEEMAELIRFKAQLLNNVSHDLSTPLTPINIQIHMLRTGMAGPMSERQEHALEVVERNLAQLSLLVQDLKDVALLQAGRLRVITQPIRLDEVVAEGVDSFQGAAAERGIALTLSRTGPIGVTADPQRVTQVLYNLLSNALKFTPAGGSIAVTVATEADEGVVRVRDTGAGLKPEDVDRLFKPFARVHDPSAITKPGTGLGLYICREILAAHRGRIWCQTEGLGRGATFAFALPVRSGPPPVPPADGMTASG